MFAKRAVAIVVVACGIYSFTSKAEFEISPWNGLYNTGGYNLLTFGNNLYDLSNYFNNYYWPSGIDSYWGGSCGSFFSSCYSPYDSLGLFGFNENWFDLNINIDINLLLSPFLYGGYCGYGGSYLCGCGSNLYNNQFCGSFQNYLGSFPYNNNYLFPYYNWTNTGQNYGWFDWNSSFLPINIGINYPVSVPVWGGCDNIFIPCASSTNPYYNTTPIVQQYSPYYNYVPTEPLRYQIPRGAMTH